MPKLKPTLLIAFDKNDANECIQSKMLNRQKISIVLSTDDIHNLTKGHKVLKTKLAYINPEYNSIVGEFSIQGYEV